MIMTWLVVFLIALIGTGVAEDYDDKWTEAELNQIFTQAQVEATAPTDQLITRNNYTVEVHTVTTDDGYILRMHRIPASPISPAAPGKPPVFLMHGLFSTSADWVETGPGKGLGYILADQGYDVWMGNARGNTYSRRHTRILSDKDYWNFSWHEIGYYDLPAMIDFALEKTGLKQVMYIGHSQGTTSFFVMTTQRPSYNAKIKAMFALAPVAYMGRLRSPVMRLAALGTNTILDVFDLFGTYMWDPSPRVIRAARAAYCQKDFLSQYLCSNYVFLICGYNMAQLNVSIVPILFGHTPAGGSVRQLGHYGQGIQSAKFRQFDHGPVKNLLIYGSLTPPDYDLSLITAPVHLLYSENDLLSAAEDVSQLYRELANPIEMWRMQDKLWAHFDYVLGIDANTVVFFPMIERMKRIYNY